MNSVEHKHQRTRVAEYNRLEELYAKADQAHRAVAEGDPNGPHGQGPFTGNWRESRDVRAMKIYFTKTKGGAPEVELELHDLWLSAPELGRALVTMLAQRKADIAAEMEKL